MAIVPMQKMLICGAIEEKSSVMKTLQRQGSFHLIPLEEERLNAPEVREALTRAEKRIQTAEQALRVLQQYAPAGGGMLASLTGAEELSPEDWEKRSGNADAAAALAEDLLQKDRRINEANARAARAQVQAEGLAPWKGLGMPLDFSGTESTRAFIGALPGAWTDESIRALLAEYCPQMDAYSLELLGGDASQTPLVLVCLKEDAEAAEDALRRKGFARPVITTDKTPEEALNEVKFDRASAITEAEEQKAAVQAAAGRRGELQFLYDDATLEAERLSSFQKAGESRTAFFVEGYVPKAKAAALQKKLEDKFTVSVIITEPDGETPVLLQNNRLSAPTETVVESYGLPGKGEIDPTAIMSVFYYFLFGMMLSDAGYGLLMVIGCAVALKKFPKMGRNMKKMLTMFFWCGVSTAVWGFLFGSFFGDAIDVIAHTFFGVPADRQVLKAIWFTPLDEPMRLLIYCFLFGIIHLFVGLGIKGVLLLKEKRTKDFLGGVLGWYLLLIGLLMILLPSDMYASIAGAPVPLPAWMQTAAKFLAIAGAVLLLLFAAWDKKFGLRLALGAYELYGVTGWLSDVLSYSRLLALGLATGVIASVINTMASMMGGGVIGAVIFIIVFLLGHTLNMAINLLGAYVHTNRLQFVEFFGKFYEAGGEAFEPLGTGDTKYYHMEEN
ncbi:MAG: V-type ATP synthase subunit I [Lachnospiraceae bacterium]|nr:V-type ATP synthase subunit I [Lachnospiraceae bacterium]